MVMFFWVSLVISRQRSPIAALAASAVFVLLIQPDQLWQLGFQLSYVVVLSILCFGLPLHGRLTEIVQLYRLHPEKDIRLHQQAVRWAVDKLSMLFAISFAAWLASAPLSAGLFGVLAPYSVLVNMLLVNIAALVICSGVISSALGLTTLTALSPFINHAAWVCISLMDLVVRANPTSRRHHRVPRLLPDGRLPHMHRLFSNHNARPTRPGRAGCASPYHP